jgi:hypothetical protein
LRKTFLILEMLIENKYNEKHKKFEETVNWRKIHNTMSKRKKTQI